MSAISIIFSLFFFVFAVLAINIVYSIQEKGSVLKAAGLVVVFAVFFTQSSLFWTKDTMYRVDVIKPLETGWPIPFHYEPHPMNQVWEAPSTSRNNFFYSIFINAGLCGAVLFLLSFLLRKTGLVVKSLSFEVVLLGLISLIIVMIGISFVNSKMAQLQNPEMNNPVTFPPSFANPVPVPLPAK